MREHPLIEEQEPPGAPPERDPLLPPTVESTLAESVVVSTQEPAEEAEQAAEDEILPSPKRMFVLNRSSIIACLLFLLLVGEHVIPLVWPVLDASLHPKATVTLFAAKEHLTFTYSFFAVIGTADERQQQIPSRVLSVTTPTRTLTLPTTGIGYTPAVQAKGELTFYNEAPYAQTIQAGTVLTGRDRIQVITDEPAFIGAGDAPTLGMAAVSAHALVGGAAGNMVALDINGLCCLAGILAKNTLAFTGGRDRQAYPEVSPADLQTATHQLATVLDPLARNSLRSRIAERERLITEVHCRAASSSTPPVGERASQVMVSVSETCTAQVIDSAALQDQVRVRFEADAAHTLPWAVLQANRLSQTLAPPRLLDSRHHTYRLRVTATGIMVLHLSETELHSLSMQLAGKPLSQAQTALLAIQGVQGVWITPAHQGESRLPAEPSQIQIVIE